MEDIPGIDAIASRKVREHVEDLYAKANKRQAIVDQCVDEERPVPLNYILEARHFRLQARILRLRNEVDRLGFPPKEHPTQIRLIETIAKAKEIGDVNRVLLDLKKYNQNVFIADI